MRAVIGTIAIGTAAGLMLAAIDRMPLEVSQLVIFSAVAGIVAALIIKGGRK